YQAIVLAVVQGLTEFLPISSTAHLWLVPWLLGWKDPGLTFDVALHAGPLLYLVIATVPAALAGWRFEHAAEEQLRSPIIAGTALIVIGLFMWAGDWLGKHERDLGH